MSVREYVGARYVPIVVGEWDKTRTYEPLMVVTYQGNSYTSRQYVPAGIDIANESYWVLSANYNAQVESYRRDVATLGEHVKTNTNNIATNTNDIATILPMDTTPTENSTKGVTSGGVYNAVTNINNSLATISPLDSAPTENSTKGITSGGVYASRIYRTIEDYGCDSSNEDNSTYLQKAINDCAKNNYILIIPAKTYTCNSAVTIPWGLTLIGVNKQYSLLNFTSDIGFNTANIDLYGYKTAFNCELANFTIRGPYSTTSGDISFYNAGITGYFGNSHIHDINIKHFQTAMYLFQVMPSSIYNTYNTNYGDLRLFENLFICNCGYGYINWQSDIITNNIDVAGCRSNPINTGYHISNVHTWGNNRPVVFQDGLLANNILIGAHGRYVNENNVPTNYEGLIKFSNIQTGCVLNNVVFRNVTVNPQTVIDSGYNYLPYMTFDTNNAMSGQISITNLYIGRNTSLSDNTKLVSSLMLVGNTSNVYIQGTISPTFTTIDSATGFSNIVEGHGKAVTDINGYIPNLPGTNYVESERYKPTYEVWTA